MPYHESGITLIDARTSKWVPGMGDSGAKCEVPEDVSDRLAARNAESLAAAPLVTASRKWRLIRPDEMTGDPPRDLLPDKTRAGEPIRTIVYLSAPAFSESGDLAFVLLSFRWSVHEAQARYVLKASGSNWKVQCSDLFFYP